MIQATFLIQVPLECSDPTKLQRITHTEFVESEFPTRKPAAERTNLSERHQGLYASVPVSYSLLSLLFC